MIQQAQHGGRLASLLGLLCLGFAYLCYAQLQEGPAQTRAPAPEGSRAIGDDQSEALDQLELEPLSVYAEIGERPLFNPTRRPPVREAAPARAAPAQALQGYALQGTTSSPEGRRALLVLRRAGRQIWVNEGERLDGWLIERIDTDGVLLSRAGRQQLLSLEDNAALRRTAPKRASPQPQQNGRTQATQAPAEQAPDASGKTAAPAAAGGGSDKSPQGEEERD